MSVKHLLLATRILDSGSTPRRVRHISPLVCASMILLEPFPLWGKAADFNPHHSPENGRFCEADGAGGGGNNSLKKIPEHVNISATGANKMYVRDFINKAAALHHWGGGGTHDHSAQYAKDGITTFEQYVERACDLLEMKCSSGGIRGYKTKMGYICRYDPVTNDFTVGHPLIGILTMFKPDDGAKYFEKNKKKEGR